MSDWQIKQLARLYEFGEKIYRLDERGEYPLLHVDEDFCRLLGYRQDEIFVVCRNKARELVYFSDVEEVCDTVKKGIAENGSYTCRYRMRKKSGELIWVWESGSLFTDMEEKECVRSIVVNVTKEENIRKERDTTFDNIPGGVLTLLITDSNFYVTEANQRYFEMVGSSRDLYLGSSGMYTFPEDLQGLRNYILKQAAGKEPLDYEFRAYSGEENRFCWYRLVGRYYSEADDGVEYMGILTDVSDRRRMLFQLETEKERYRIAVGNMPGFFFEYTLETKEMKVFSENRSSDLIPRIPSSIRGTWEEILLTEHFIYPEDYEDLLPLLASDDTEHTKVRLLTASRKTGEEDYQWYELKLTKIREDGKIVRVAGSARNIQQQREKEQSEGELKKIYEFYMDKIFEIILRIRVPEGEVKNFFQGNIENDPGFPGKNFDEFISFMVENHVHPEDTEQFKRAMNLTRMQEILQTSKMEESLFFRIRWGKEEYRHKCIRYCYFGYEQKEIILNLQDVHHFKEEQIIEEQANRRVLQDALDGTRSLAEMRRNFHSMLARELRSPLRYVQSTIQRMDDADENIQEAVMYMANVVNVIAELEKLESGEIRLRNKRFVLDESLRECLKGWEKRGKALGLSFQYNVNLAWRDYYGDEAKILRLLDHVIGNCMLASEAYGSGVEVWIHDQMQGNGISRLIITVEDWGIPVTDGYFGREYPIEVRDNERDWKYFGNRSGTAFSLIVARKLVEMMGGRMVLTRKSGTSNVMTIEILLQKMAGNTTDTKIADIDGDEEGREILKGYFLLLVRHKKKQQKTSAPMLRLNGARTDVVSGGMEALSLFRSYPPGTLDAILVEGNLGDMDYLEFTEQIRREKREDAATVPIIAVVEEVSADTIREGMQIGVNSWLDSFTDLARLRLLLDTLHKGTLNL